MLRPLNALELGSARTTFTFAHLAVRVAFTFAGTLALHAYLRRRLSVEGVQFGVLLFFAVLPVTYIFYGIQPSDPSNFAFFTLGLLLIERQQFWPLLVLMPLSILSRETTLLLVPAWFAVAWQRRAGLAWSVWTTAAIGIAGLAVYVGLRAVFGMRPTYTEWSDPWVAIPYNLFNPWSYLLLGLFLGWQAVIVAMVWRRLDATLRTLLVVVGTLMFVVHLAVGRLAEIRLFVPLLPLTLSAVVPWLREEAHLPPDTAPAPDPLPAGAAAAPPTPSA